MLFCAMIVSSLLLFAQSPQSFQYQSVVRDGSGDVIVNQPVSFQISIISGSPTGNVEYSETHSVTTNGFGLVNLSIGEGTVVSGTFSGIGWGSNLHFIKVEADINGSSIYTDMGTTQLLSVPYALHSKTSEDAFSGNYGDLNGVPSNVSAFTNDAGYVTTSNDADAVPSNEIQSLSIAGNNLTISGGNTVAIPQNTYTAGNGLTLTGTQFTHNAHSGDVSGTTALTVTGIQGNAVSSGAPASGQILKFNGTSWVPSADNVDDADNSITNEIQTMSLTGNNLSLTGGGTVSLSGYVDTLWKSNGTRIYNSNAGNVGVGINNPSGKMVVQGDATLTDSDPLFEVKDRTGATVFVVYPDSVRIFVFDDGSKTNKGAFAVSGRNTAKLPTNDFLVVTPDSSRIYTGDETKGFGVRHIGSGTKDSYMKLTPANYFIGHKSGDSITTGMYNNYFGYESGLRNKIGYYNVFMGYYAGHNNIDGSSNTFLGYSAGWNSNGQSNIAVGSNSLGNSNTGSANVAVGNQSLAFNTSGEYNVAVGNNAMFYNSIGTYNVALGVEAMRNNSSGNQNIALGYQALYDNNSGNENVALGYMAGYSNSTGERNLFVGREAGYSNNDGIYNQFLGHQAGYSNTSGGHNNFIGYQAGYHNTTGWTNAFIGGFSGYNNSTGMQNVFIGAGSGVGNTVGNNNVYIGYSCANANVGAGNVFIGFEAGKTGAYSDRLFIENSSTTTVPLINGDFANDRIAFNRMATTYPLQVGTNTTNGNQAYLTAGGNWMSTSTKTVKDRFQEIDRDELLSKIEQLEIKGWYYKETQEYHIGPFAEDFYSAFGTGVLDEPIMLGKSLAAGDVAGVSLAAVKELIIQNKLQQEEIDRLKEENRKMRFDIDKLLEN